MNTSEAKRALVSDLEKKSQEERWRSHPSMCYSGGDGGLSSETAVEQFTLDAPDGTRFLIQVTKLGEQ